MSTCYINISLTYSVLTQARNWKHITEVKLKSTMVLLWLLTSDLRKLLMCWCHHFCDFSLKSFSNLGNVIFLHITRKLQIMWGKWSQSLSHLLIVMAGLVCLKTSSISPLLLLLLINSQSTIFTEQSCVPLD